MLKRRDLNLSGETRKACMSPRKKLGHFLHNFNRLSLKKEQTIHENSEYEE
jgi:hypothetical protein